MEDELASNSFENSFDYFIPNTRDKMETEKMDSFEEDFDLVTIENVSIDELVKRIRRLLIEIIRRGNHGSINQLFEIAVQIIYRSTMFKNENNPVVEAILKGFVMILLNVQEKNDDAFYAEKSIFMFIVKLAIVSKTQKCEDLFQELCGLIDKYFYHPESEVRAKIRQLIYLIMIEANNLKEIEQENGNFTYLFENDSDSPQDAEEIIIPNGIEEKWLRNLSASVLDRSPNVREKSILALSQFDHNRCFKDKNGNEVTPNQLITKSITDFDETVRNVAIKSVHIIEPIHIDKCMDFIENCTDNKIRHQLVVRLAATVHLFSFSESQRFRLINILLNSESARMQDVIHQHLVDSWMNVAYENVTCLTVFKRKSDQVQFFELDETKLAHFPSIILEYLDPTIDPNAVSIVLKFAITRYIRMSTGISSNTIDFEEFLKNLTEMSRFQCENLGLMTRCLFRLLPASEIDEQDDQELWIKKTYFRIYFLRYLIDSIFQLTNDNSIESVNIRDRALRFLVIGVAPLTKQTEEFCLEYFQDEKILEMFGVNLEFILLNLFHIFNRIIEENNDSYEISILKKMIETLLENNKMKFTPKLVEIMCTIRLDLCKSNFEEIKEATDWMCYTANNCLISGKDGAPLGEDLTEMQEKGLILTEMIKKCASILYAMCRHENVNKCSVLMLTLLKFLLPELLSNKNDDIVIEGIEMIGYSAVIDLENAKPFLILVKMLLTTTKNDLIKAASLNSLFRVIKAKSFEQVAELIFSESELGDDCEKSKTENLADFFVKQVSKMRGIGLIQAIRDVLSIFSFSGALKLFWPEMMALVLKKIFDKKERNPKMVRFFMKFCRKSVTNIANKIHLMNAFLMVIEFCEEEASETDCQVLLAEMSQVVCEHFCSFQEENSNFTVTAELCRRLLKSSKKQPTNWTIRHVFTSLATTVNLSVVPIKQLIEIRDLAEELMESVLLVSNRLTIMTVKRFLVCCQKYLDFQSKQSEILEPKIEVKKEIEGEEESCKNVEKRKRFKSPQFCTNHGTKRRKNDLIENDQCATKISMSRRTHFDEDEIKKENEEVETIDLK